MSFYSKFPRDASSFRIFSDSMLQDSSLPLSDVIDQSVFDEAFELFDVDFSCDDDAVYTPALVLWALLSQALFKDEQRSCNAAVTRIAAWWAAQGRVVDDTNSGAYCRARQKISDELVAHLVRTIAQRAEKSSDLAEPLDDEQAEAMLTPRAIADVKSKPLAGRVLMVDGFTVDAADTPENQKEYPQNPSQEEGLGFPLLRCVSLVSMATGMLVDLAIAPYCGKETGETALLRQMIDSLGPGDVLVADSYYCTYWLLAMCQARGVEVVMKNHHKRDDHPEDAVRICKGQRKVVWPRPQRPTWMSREEYALMPKQVEVRLVDIKVDEPGFRPEGFTIATTIVDHRVYTDTWIGSVYQSRWLVELDIRSIKCSLGMDILRAKTPPMVRTELWSCLLAYNLTRLKMLQSGIDGSRDVRSMSFTRSMVLLGTSWLLCGARGVNDSLVELGQAQPLDELVGHREGRIEPRANKRRPKVLKLLTAPRAAYQVQLGSAA
ncbi:Transposase DDE domain protein [Rubripirellula tenax]|uniref:Transposase DDE domain protein n=1 Tax=Rubripirellula tenax TaxID=2528015 RepID=A0A5C6EZ43_9BACT|nr:IS4 family transposase [Rubripirellula tenax]TWU54428.1 Transposase DDE domain protein [Rubripirellula tenax]